MFLKHFPATKVAKFCLLVMIFHSKDSFSFKFFYPVQSLIMYDPNAIFICNV